MTTQAEALHMIADCEARESRLDIWEVAFIDSISKKIEMGRRLTKKQDETLNRIWDKVTENG